MKLLAKMAQQLLKRFKKFLERNQLVNGRADGGSKSFRIMTIDSRMTHGKVDQLISILTY